MVEAQSKTSEEYKKLWEEHSVEAQIKLVKNEADANHATLVFYAIKDDLESFQTTEINKLGSGSTLNTVFNQLEELDLITNANLTLLKNPQKTREYENRLKDLIGSKGRITADTLITFTKELFSNGDITPVSERISDEVAEAYHKNLINFRKRNANIENSLKEIINNFDESTRKLELYGKPDNIELREDLKRFLDDFIRFRIQGGEPPFPNSGNLGRIIQKYILNYESIRKSTNVDPYNEKNNSLSANLKNRRIKEQHEKKGDEEITSSLHNGPKTKESAVRKAEYVYKGDYSQIRDIARIRNIHYRPNASWVNNIFSQFFAEKNGFKIYHELSKCKGLKSGTSFSKTIYGVPVGNDGEYLTSEVQNYSTIEHKIDKDVLHEIYEPTREFYDQSSTDESKKRQLSTGHITLGKAKEILEDANRIVKKLNNQEFKFFERCLVYCQSEKISVKFHQAKNALSLVTSPSNNDILNNVKSWGTSLKDIKYDNKISDLKNENSPVKKESVERLERNLLGIAERLEVLHLTIALVAKSMAPIEERFLSNKLLVKAFTDKETEEIEKNIKSLLDELLEQRSQENLTDQQIEKIKKDTDRYINHFNKGKSKDPDPNVKELLNQPGENIAKPPNDTGIPGN